MCTSRIAMGDLVASQIATIVLVNHIIYRKVSVVFSLLTGVMSPLVYISLSAERTLMKIG